MIAALVVGLWPDHARELNFEKAIAIGVAALAWLFSELSGFISASGHDVELFNKYRETLVERNRAFLREHDFRNTFLRAGVDGLNEMSHWDGAAYEFNDSSVQRKWGVLLAQIKAFMNKFAEYTVPIGTAGFTTVVPNGADPENPPAWARAQMLELNELATLLYGQTEAFERFTRKRLGL